MNYYSDDYYKEEDGASVWKGVVVYGPDGRYIAGPMSKEAAGLLIQNLDEWYDPEIEIELGDEGYSPQSPAL